MQPAIALLKLIEIKLYLIYSNHKIQIHKLKHKKKAKTKSR